MARGARQGRHNRVACGTVRGIGLTACRSALHCIRSTRFEAGTAARARRRLILRRHDRGALTGDTNWVEREDIPYVAHPDRRALLGHQDVLRPGARYRTAHAKMTLPEGRYYSEALCHTIQSASLMAYPNRPRSAGPNHQLPYLSARTCRARTAFSFMNPREPTSARPGRDQQVFIADMIELDKRLRGLRSSSHYKRADFRRLYREAPSADCWPHEIKHDGYLLIAVWSTAASALHQGRLSPRLCSMARPCRDPDR